MPREKDSFRDHVKFLPNNKWKCNFCSKEYGGSVTRIKAHLAGVAGYGINDCKDVDGRVRSEARNALKGKGAAEPSSGAEGNVEEGPHLPATANNEDAWREPSFAAMPYLSSDVMSTVGASSSAFLPLPETNLPSQSPPAQSMIPLRDCSFWPQQPQSQAGDSSNQAWIYLSSRPDFAPEALTNMPAPVNAEEGETNTEVPQDARTNDAIVDSRPGTFGLVNEYMPTLKRKLDELSSQVANLDELGTWWRKAKRRTGEYWSMVQAFQEGRSLSSQQVKKVKRMVDLSKEVEDIIGHFSLQKGSTTHVARCRKSSPLVTTELVGEEREETIQAICDYLVEDEIVIIGVYGMGGVGKTAILMHVYNRVFENPTFNDVFWVTVPQEFSVYELQDKIANVVGLDNLSKEKDVMRNASILNRHLKKKKRSVLVLDGLWMNFEVEDVGIPIEKGGLKLVLTTRSLDVCHKMLCQKQIKIEPLRWRTDCWILFMKKLRFRRELPSEVKKIAQSIVDKCKGLPFGIIEIATRMRGVEELHRWKDMLRRLEDSRVELDVFKRLKLSYINLGDPQVQQCFMHLIICFGEDISEINRKDLIESFIDEGLLGGIATRQELHDEGNTILDKIRDACLCYDDLEEQYMHVHPLIRDMALQIVRSTTHVVKARMGLEEIPKEEFWTDRLEKVFLQGNDMEEIPDGISPNCPKLTRLSLNDNVCLEAINKSFFKHLKGLKVLDLSGTKLTELPDIISHMESLEALLLRECEELCHIPCIQYLGSLRKLDLNGCAMLEEVPEGMEMSLKLSYLDLQGTGIETLPEGVLGKLVNLQYLAIRKGMALEWTNLKVEGLYCSVSNVETFNACVRFLEQNSSLPYELWLNESGYHSFKDMHERRIIIKSCHSIAARVDEEIGGDGHALLPKNVQVLKVRWCDGVTSLCDVSPLDNLEKLKIEEWEKLEKLGAVHFPHLRRLKITRCSKLKHLLEEGQGLPRLHWFRIEGSEELEEINMEAPLLYNIEVYRCPKMKRAVEWERLATRLPNLRSIKISNCEKLEEIIGGRPAMPIGATCLLAEFQLYGCNNMKGALLTHDMLLRLPYLQGITVQDCKGIEVIIGTVPDVTHPILPNLLCLTLHNLPELKSVCDGIVSWVSFQRIHIENCPKLKRLPLADKGFSCPPLYLRSIWIDQMTWESLEYPPPSLRSTWIDWLTWTTPELDYPFFESSLEHLLRFHEDWRNRKRPIIIPSCDGIAARVDKENAGYECNLLLKNAPVLEIGRGSGVTSLSEVGPLENLEELTIEGWEKLEELGPLHFPRLRELNITRCSKLKHLLEVGQEIPRLQSLYIEGSKELEGIKLAAPNLNRMEVSGCPKMKRAVEWEWLATRLPNLKFIGIYDCEKLEEIIGGPLPIGATCLLTVLRITGCNNMMGALLTHDMLLRLPYLQDIAVQDCKGIEVIIGTVLHMSHPFLPNLMNLTLNDLPELKSICDGMVSCDSIRCYAIFNCPKLKRIPLRLGPLHNGVPSPPPSLREIWIHRQQWESLEWDHPLARSSLEPFANIFRFDG